MKIGNFHGNQIDFWFPLEGFKMTLRSFLFFYILICFPFFANSETQHNCVKIGDRINCSSQSREEANTPPTTYRLGSKAYCLVSKMPTKKYFCNYETYDKCLVFANVDNLSGMNKSSCTPNSAFRSSDVKNSEIYTRDDSVPSERGYSRGGRSEESHDSIAALTTAFQEGDYETAAKLALSNPNNPVAQALLAAMYAEGKGVPKDKKQSTKWLERAANNGVREAQEVLGKNKDRTERRPDNYSNDDYRFILGDGLYLQGQPCVYQRDCSHGFSCELGVCK